MNTQTEYLSELAQAIRNLPERDRQELLAEYEDHFVAGKERGKSEAEIAQALGSPKAVAQSIMMNSWVAEAGKSPAVLSRSSALFHVLLSIMILAPLNFFMLLCPFLILFVLVMVGWIVPLAVGAASFAAFIAFMQASGVGFGFLSSLSVLFMFFGSIGLATLGGLIMFLITRISLQILFSYAKWNVDFITSRRPQPALGA